MATYKTKDLEIISPITRGEVQPQEVKIANIDTSVRSLLKTNIYQGSEKNYSGEIMDYSYTSSQDIKMESDFVKKNVQELKEKLPKKPKIEE